MPHEDHIAPVGFAREPRNERRRWFGRILLFAFVGVLSWMLIARVIGAPDDSLPGHSPGAPSSTLPGPR